MKYLFLVIFMISLNGCFSNETIDPEIFIRSSSKYKYEVQIRKHVKGRGNLHNLNFDKFEYDNSDWIYLNKLEGRIQANDLIFTRYWGCLDDSWRASKLKGYIEFKNNKIEIALIGPQYEDGVNISGYKPLDINGIYGIVNVVEEYKPTNREIDGAPCDRSWMRRTQ